MSNKEAEIIHEAARKAEVRLCRALERFRALGVLATATQSPRIVTVGIEDAERILGVLEWEKERKGL